MSSFKEMLGQKFIKFADVNNLKKVQACIDLGVDINATDADLTPFSQTAAHVAASMGHTGVIRLLAATGRVDWNKQDKQISYTRGFTPLHGALQFRSYEVAAIIMQQDGIDFSLRASTGTTVAQLAVFSQNVPMVEILAKKENCNIWNIPDQSGDTPIMDAILKGNPDILKILLACPRVDPNVEDWHGDSPVMMAIKEEKVALAKILIKCPRVDLRSKDRDGSSLQKIAR